MNKRPIMQLSHSFSLKESGLTSAELNRVYSHSTECCCHACEVFGVFVNAKNIAHRFVRFMEEKDHV